MEGRKEMRGRKKRESKKKEQKEATKTFIEFVLQELYSDRARVHPEGVHQTRSVDTNLNEKRGEDEQQERSREKKRRSDQNID
jgi:hypothetical protein